MEEVLTCSTTTQRNEFTTTKLNRHKGLVDIPISTQISEALINVFNYFDIYGPKIPTLYMIVTWLRLFQLIGGAFMVANPDIFNPTTLTFKVMSIFSIFFHLVPAQYREGFEPLILFVINGILTIFLLYLVITAFQFQKTMKVPDFSLKILSIYMVFGPFLLIPLMSQYAGQVISGVSVGVFLPTAYIVTSVVYSAVVIIAYFWVMIVTYSSTLTFRPCSFISIEGGPQNKLFFTTTLVTFVTALATYWTRVPSTACSIIAILCYVFSASSCFNCGTYVKTRDQVLVLGGSALGIIICLVSFYPMWDVAEWTELFFVGFAVTTIITFLLTDLYIKRRQRRDMMLLDQFHETTDIELFKTEGKFRRVIGTGFTFAHPVCIDFSGFKVAVETWPDSLEIWMEYAKFTAIYPENTNQLQFIGTNIDSLNSDSNKAKICMANIQTILKTRETSLSFQLKNKLSKLSKVFNKTKNRIRNIWDLVLQGSIDEMINAIRNSQISIKQAEVEMNQLLMNYPNNRYVARKLAQFHKEIKADNIAYKESIEDVKKLQRGLRVNADMVHDLGIECFPNLPEIADSESVNYGNIMEGESFNIDETLLDDDSLIESTEVITRQIEKHKIPAIQYMYFSTIILYVCLIFLPLLLIMALYPYYIGRMSEPLNMMYGVSYSRNLINMMPAFIGKFLFENLDNPDGTPGKMMDRVHLNGKVEMDGYGGYNETGDIMGYLINQVAVANAVMADIRSYKFGNKYMEIVRDLLFSRTLNYTFYLSHNETFVSASSVVDISYMVAQHVGKISAKKGNITVEDTYGTDVLTARNNAYNCTIRLSSALEQFIHYIQDMDQANLSFVFILMIVLFLTNLFAYAITFNVQYDKLKRNKEEILNILTTLPKKVISNVSSSLNCVKAGESLSYSVSQVMDIEMSRQEEGIIKLFTSISDSASSSSSESMNLIFMTIITICGCIGYNLTLIDYIQASSIFVNNCYHFDYLFGSITYMFSAFSELFKITLKESDPKFEYSLPNMSNSIEILGEHLYNQVYSFSKLRFGGTKSTEVPYQALPEAFKNAEMHFECKNYSALPTNYVESSHCFTIEQQIYLTMSRLVGFFVWMTNDTAPIYPAYQGMDLQDLWQVGPIELYVSFFYPTTDSMISVFKSSFDQINFWISLYGSAIIFVTFIFTAIILRSIRHEERLLKGILHLLLYCPPTVILKNQCIMNLISGKYSTRSDEDIVRLNKFNGKVVNKLNDVVIVCHDDDNTVIGVNKAFKQMFGLSQADMVNTNIKDFFTKDCFKYDCKVEHILAATTNVVYDRPDNNKVYLQFSVNHAGEIKIISGRDMTQNVLHERLIADEKKKSDKMLASILPASLVPKVQAGEKNISFSVQSATVLFLDVVSFTPWCGSHDAQYVMRFLNIMFKEFDAITNVHKTMTKIKCIGDCYMAAGGIFDEVNQPAVHAKEVVDFGCCVIRKLLEIDERENEQLRIRVGINTGGPIVAGVIGTEKPTFEILGPAINIAHEMESHGVPMKVHISRPVYELIYGQQFTIQERGEIEVKKGKMFTYLVEP